jgi:hypothetical protein
MHLPQRKRGRVWLCLGGPLHGTYRPAGKDVVTVPVNGPPVYGLAIVRQEASLAGVAGEAARVAYASPAKPVLYYPGRMQLPGWRVTPICYLESSLATGHRRWLAPGTVIPGSIVAQPGEFEQVCEWCFGRPMPGLTGCSRVACIVNLAMVRALDTLTADDAKGWADDEEGWPEDQ